MEVHFPDDDGGGGGGRYRIMLECGLSVQEFLNRCSAYCWINF
jgi:hypothetical protein